MKMEKFIENISSIRLPIVQILLRVSSSGGRDFTKIL